MNSGNNTPHVDTSKIGIVKLIVSGDTITISDEPRGGPPPEKTITLSNIVAPKLGRKGPNNDDVKDDEPWAWEAREFLRKKLVGQYVVFTEDKVISPSKIYGSIWLGRDKNTGENVAELLVAEGLASLKLDNVRNPNPAQLRLKELEEVAKRGGKGKWSNSPSSEHVRDIKWNVDNPNAFLETYGGKLCKAIVEHVRDGSTVRVLLLPDFYYITVMMSGIKCPPPLNKDKERDPLGEEALYFTERRILQRDVEVVIEAKGTYCFVGMILHPVGNIAEFLLREGLAKCVPMQMHLPKTNMESLFQAEKVAKNKKLRLWQNYVPSEPIKGYVGVVDEIVGADSLIIRTSEGSKKIFLSSIRPPQKEKISDEDKNAPRSKDFRPLYDIPFMFQARELLRKKLIHKQVKITEDYIQPAKDQYPEKICCSVMLSKTNIAEVLVSKGLATVIRHKQDDPRSPHYNELLVAENLAEKNQSGLHSKKNLPVQRIIDVSNDPAKAKFHLSALKRASGAKAIVEFVASGSRLKLFLPKEQCIITFLLAGVKVPRRSRPKPGGGVIEGEQYSEEAYKLTKTCCFQQDVEIDIETMETKGSGFIGWLFVSGVNLSVQLVENGLAEVTFTQNGEYLKLLKAAEERAKKEKLNIWSIPRIELEIENPDEEKEIEERKVEPREVVVSDINENLHFYAQYVDQRSQFEGFLSRLRQELEANPPLPGAFNPKRGELVAAKFSGDNQWYRAKVEKVSGTNVSLFYIDYGNREVVNVTKVAPLPSEFSSEKPYAHEYAVAYVLLPKDEDDKKAAITAIQEDVENKTLLLTVVYKSNGVLAATLVDPVSNEDIVKALITHGYLLVQENSKKSQIKEEYLAAQKEAKTHHRNIWQYGDITADDQ